MRVPLRFFLGLLGAALLCFAAFFALVFGQFGAPSAGSAWAAQITARKVTAARAISGPKLLVAGGSGVLFGVKARQLETALGIPCVNISTHAALGTSYVLEVARRTAVRGDTILLIPEYELYEYGNASRTEWADAVYLDYMMAAEPAYLQHLPPIALARLLLRVPAARIREGWMNRFHPPAPRQFASYHPYDPANVDDHGDMTGHRADRIPEKSRGALGTSEVLAHGLSADRSGMHDLSEFCQWAAQHEIRLLAALPVLCAQPAYDGPQPARTAAEIETFWKTLRVPMLGTFPEMLLPRREFFDTQYHLTEEAAAIRTTRLAEELAPYFAPQARR